MGSKNGQSRIEKAMNIAKVYKNYFTWGKMHVLHINLYIWFVKPFMFTGIERVKQVSFTKVTV